MSWFTSLVQGVKQAAGGAVAYIQTPEGLATLGALMKAGEMVQKARKGDTQEQAKINGVAALAEKGDPAAKQGLSLLQLVNNLAKKQEGKAAAAVVGLDAVPTINGELAVDSYDWDW